MERFHIFADYEFWCAEDSESEALDYAKHLVEMDRFAPEAKADHVKVVDSQTGEVLLDQKRIDL